MQRALKTAWQRTRGRASGWSILVILGLALVPTGSFGQQGRNSQSGRVMPNTGVSRVAAESNIENSGRDQRRDLRNIDVELPNAPETAEGSVLPGGIQPEQLVSPGGLSSTLNLLVMMTVLSLAPSILIMTTCFIRFVIVLGLLRQALGTQQLPPNQVMVALSLFLTFLVMSPVWQQSYNEGIRPYTQPEAGVPSPSLEQTFTHTVAPIRTFMEGQIKQSNNSDTVWMLLDYQRPDPESVAGRNYQEPTDFKDVPLPTLMSAFMLSELKTAFLIGFQIYLPFLVIDMVVSTILMSMGMMMLPPTLVSFPFKLLLFVLIDGWALTVHMMLSSVHPPG